MCACRLPPLLRHRSNAAELRFGNGRRWFAGSAKIQPCCVSISGRTGIDAGGPPTWLITSSKTSTSSPALRDEHELGNADERIWERRGQAGRGTHKVRV
jgi:hypothetical protein